MKNPNMSFPVIFLSIVLAVVSAPSAVHAQGTVLDTKGRPVRAGEPYYVLPADGNGGGLRHESRATFHPRPCPHGVVQAQFPGSLGDPVTFSPWNSKLGFVPASTNLTIEFSPDSSSCPDQPLVWTSAFSAWLRGSYVSTGGEVGREGSWFNILEDGGGGYKILHSRSGDQVGIFDDHLADARVVVLGFRPLRVKFEMAYETTDELLKKTG